MVVFVRASLTEDSKLLPATRKHLQDEYAKLKERIELLVTLATIDTSISVRSL